MAPLVSTIIPAVNAAVNERSTAATASCTRARPWAACVLP
jgi:hypothetical protein